MVGTWVSRTLFSMRWARVRQQSPALKTGALGSYCYPPRSVQMQHPEELHLTLVQGRRGDSNAKRTQRDEMRLTPQSRGAARCDESFEETRNSLGKKVVFSSLEKRQKGGLWATTNTRHLERWGLRKAVSAAIWMGNEKVEWRLNCGSKTFNLLHGLFFFSSFRFWK